MNKGPALCGALLATAVYMPVAREWLEADMARHMLVQFPALIAAGALCSTVVSDRVRSRVAEWNAHGVPGLLLCISVLSFWMIPRALDEAVQNEQIATIKLASLLGCGFLLSLSWREAGSVVQLFFLGNWAWMGASAGLLYQQWPSRLCAVYLIDQQATTGFGLVVMAVVVPVAWLISPDTRKWLMDPSDPCPKNEPGEFEIPLIVSVESTSSGNEDI